jgi:hypothetical protein
MSEVKFGSQVRQRAAARGDFAIVRGGIFHIHRVGVHVLEPSWSAAIPQASVPHCEERASTRPLLPHRPG